MTTVNQDLEEVSIGVECSLCTFPDRNAAAREFARSLRPGGLATITDVTLTGAGILSGAGLHVRHTQAHHDGLLTIIERIAAQITALRIAAPQLLTDNGIAPDTATDAVKAGRIGDTLTIAEKRKHDTPPDGP